MQMKKTAIQLVYELIKSGLSPEEVVNYLLIDEELMLEKEKEQIGRAYQEGLLDGMNHTPKDYYNQTYNKQ
jgi:hypothetical protein